MSENLKPSPEEAHSGSASYAERVYRSLVEHLPIFVCRKDLNGRFTFVNSAFCELLGHPPEEILGKTHFDFNPPELAQKYAKDELLVAESGETLQTEEENVKDGQARYMNVVKTPVLDDSGKTVEIQVVFWDVSDRKSAEESLRRSERRLRLMLQQTPAVVWSTDSELRFTSSSGAGLERLKLKNDEVVGLTLYEYFQTDDPEFLTIACSLRALKGESLEFEQLWAENYYDVRVEPLRDFDGRIIGTLGIAQDITVRKMAEQNLRDLNESLEEEVRERTATLQAYADELRRQSRELQRSNRELDEFVSIVTHDLQAPLRAVRTYCDLLRNHFTHKLDDEAEEVLEQTVDSVTRMDKLVDNLRDLAKVQTEARPLSWVDFEECLADALANLESDIQSSGAKVQCGKMPQADADGTQVMQLFQNLIANALKHSELRPAISVRAEETEQEWIFHVEDNGVGISPDDAQRIFHPFVRLRPQDEDGVGLGLAICQRIVARHQGRIWAEPKPGGGSVFSFSIPKQPD